MQTPSRERCSDSSGRPHLVIVGAGSAAFAAAIRAAELDARVTLVERGTMGGTCVNVGCVPSKTLIKAAEAVHSSRSHRFSGIPGIKGDVKLAALMAQKKELVEELREEKYRKVLRAYGAVEYVEGNARFLDPSTLRVDLHEGGQRRVEAERVIIASGAAAWIPPIPGLRKVPFWTNVEALEAAVLPERLIVLGGSSVGVELAQMFSRLGSRVTILEALPRLMPHEDEELARALGRYFREEGIEVYCNARTHSVSYEKSTGFRLEVDVDGKTHVLVSDQLLVATGRRANTGGLNLEGAGVETDQCGSILVDDYLRTSQSHIYAAGDCANLPHFVYVAAKAGTWAAENALRGDSRRLDLSALPAVTFTDPQFASVGLTEAGAREKGLEPETRTLPLEHVPRAQANRDTRGMVKIVCRKDDLRILGVHALTPAAGELIQTAVLAVKLGLTVPDLTDTLFPYLTEVESLKLAAQTFHKSVAQLSCCAG